MHINLESDYAVRIVHCLSIEYYNSKGVNLSRIDAQSISDKITVSLRFTLKIMRKLVAADIVKSFKGAHGGYILNKDPKDITLQNVIEAVEGPYQFSRCISDDYSCNCSTSYGEGGCPFRDVYNDITQIVNKQLELVTFEQLAKKKECCC